MKARSTALAGGAPRPGPAPVRPDVRAHLWAPVAGRTFDFEIAAVEAGILAGSRALSEEAAALGIQLDWLAEDGHALEPGAAVCRARGVAWQVARAEEYLMAAIGKPSGVATAAAELVAMAGRRARIVCGAMKKVPAEFRRELRHAATVGGASMRILERPFVYLNATHVRVLGGIGPAVRHARALDGRAVVVKLRGETAPIAAEAEEAAAAGAEVLMVGTGLVSDVALVVERLATSRPGCQPSVGFLGGVDALALPAVVAAGATVLEVGRAILDAPLVDFRLRVR